MHAINNILDRFEAEGTVFGAINKNQFEGICWIAPKVELVNEFGKMIFPIDERIEKNTRETITLASLRDTLLPKLISGELRIPEAEKVVDEALR